MPQTVRTQRGGVAYVGFFNLFLGFWASLDGQAVSAWQHGCNASCPQQCSEHFGSSCAEEQTAHGNSSPCLGRQMSGRSWDFNREPQTRLAVQLPRGSRVPISARVRHAPVRRYEMTVISDVWPTKSRSERRALQKEKPSGKAGLEDEDSATSEDRAHFWMARAQRFHVGCHFPALVTKQLLPSWRTFAEDDPEPPRVSHPRQVHAIAEALSKPTVSHNAKQRSKCETDLSTSWCP